MYLISCNNSRNSCYLKFYVFFACTTNKKKENNIQTPEFCINEKKNPISYMFSCFNVYAQITKTFSYSDCLT